MPENSNIIKRLVFSGGGAKGAVYPGAYAALEETGVFADVEDIAGSSAGAFTAALLAVGMSTKEFQLALVGTNFADMLGDMCETSWLTRDGKPLYNFLRNTIKNLVLTFLINHELNDSHHCWPILQKLNDDESTITFSDLEKLNKSWPTRFKRLTVIAVKENGGDLKVFNHLDSPEIEIALACRASGAIPLFLKPVEIDGENYIDGGVNDNIPSECFDKNHEQNIYEKNKYMAQTLVFAFLDGDKNETKTTIQRVIEFFFGGSSVFNALYGSRKNEHDNLQLFRTLFDLVQNELIIRMKSNTDNTPIEKLIDAAVDSVSENYKNYNWSWIMHAFAIIVSAIVTIWTFICNLFQAPYRTTPDTSAPKTEESDSMTYLEIIRSKLKEASQQTDSQPETHEHVNLICDHANKTMCPKLHTLGPHKPPVLFDRHPIEYYAYNFIPKLFSSFNSTYQITDTIEAGFQRLRSDYPLRTVALGIGNLSAMDFDKATKYARCMSARGYLDTINTVSNLRLHRKHFIPKQFYTEITQDFIEIYREILETSKKNPDTDPFLRTLTRNEHSNLFKYYLIKEEAETDITSEKAFALTYAIEFRRGELSREKLFEELDARYFVEEKKPQLSRSSFFKNSPSKANPAASLIDQLGCGPL